MVRRRNKSSNMSRYTFELRSNAVLYRREPQSFVKGWRTRWTSGDGAETWVLTSLEAQDGLITETWSLVEAGDNAEPKYKGQWKNPGGPKKPPARKRPATRKPPTRTPPKSPGKKSSRSKPAKKPAAKANKKT